MMTREYGIKHITLIPCLAYFIVPVDVSYCIPDSWYRVYFMSSTGEDSGKTAPRGGAREGLGGARQEAEGDTSWL